MTERAISPESAKDATSNSRMGELVLLKTLEAIPKLPSYIEVARVYATYNEAKQKLGEDNPETLQAKHLYDEYFSRMDPDEYGLMMLEYNHLKNISTDNNPDQ